MVGCYTQWVKAANPSIVLQHKQDQGIKASEPRTLNLEPIILDTKLFQRLRSEKVAPVGQLLMQKFELQMPNLDKPEITKYKHQITNKFQISISKSQIRSDANCLGF
jgi:hypothetical protein